jgi:predicted MFS family arabinose efflux permease
VLPPFVLGPPLRWGEATLGLCLGLAGLGGLAGAALAPAAVRRLGARRVVAGAFPAILALPATLAAVPHAAAVVPAIALAGLVSPPAAVAVVTHRQRSTPPHLLGRTNAAFQAVGIGAATLGATTAGAVQPALGPRGTFAAAAVTGAAALAALRPARALPRTTGDG